ncbi:hypothetical protein ACS5PN_22585 [Roseateles sp. NT4]|uniref:hypothetical protein n=1 Tax=Roseateles sp. NT4 TaxID=3453715 RepID=UPI003EEDED34
MKANKPAGFAALLEKMPKRFVARFRRVEERAQRKREAQAKRFEEDFGSAAAAKVKSSNREEWQDTVAAQFNLTVGDDE